MEAIRRKQNGSDLSLDDIRAMFREELKSVSVASSPTPGSSMSCATIPNLTDEEKAQNEESVLSTIAMFD